MFSIKHVLILLVINFSLSHLLKASKKYKRNSHEYINCQNFTHIKKPFDIVLYEEYSFEDKPESIETIVDNLNLNAEKIRYSLCQIKTSFENDINRAEIAADTFNNDRLEQLDGTVTSRKIGSALSNTVLKIGECVTNVAKQVLVLPIRLKPEIPCITKELVMLKKFSTDIAHDITGSLKSIVQYPRQMVECFKTDGKINCLSKIHKQVMKNALVDIMKVVSKSSEIDEQLQKVAEIPHKCPNYGTTIAKLATIPLTLAQCISNKIY